MKTLLLLLISCCLSAETFTPAPGSTVPPGPLTITWSGSSIYGYYVYAGSSSGTSDLLAFRTTTPNQNTVTFTVPASGVVYFNWQNAQSGIAGTVTYPIGSASQPPTVSFGAPYTGNIQTYAWTTATWGASNASGADGIRQDIILFQSTNGPAPYCQIMYHRGVNQLFLINDAGNAWLTGVTPGTGGVISNSVCSINPAAATVTANGASLVVAVPLMILAPYNGYHATKVYVDNPAGQNSGWVQCGAFTAYSIPQGASMTTSQIGDTGQSNSFAASIDGGKHRPIPTPTASTAHSRTYKLKSGASVEIPRADLVNVENFDYAYSPGGYDSWDYTFKNDNQWFMLRVGDGYDQVAAAPAGSKRSGPKGSMGGSLTWFWKLGAVPPTGVGEYSVNSKWLPGLVEVYILSQDPTNSVDISHDTPEIDHQDLADLAGMKHNAKRIPAIGPAFPPGVTKEEVLTAINRWVYTMDAAAFLSPLLKGASLDEIQTETRLQKDTVQCLRDLNVF